MLCLNIFIHLKVEIELLVPDTLPTSAESSESNSSTWLELYFESVHVEMFCKKVQRIYRVYNGSKGKPPRSDESKQECCLGPLP
uniref:Uncharacterized protein n=1 Tax=Cucumis melo TaxID=3656 RepID=A0A9I9EH54_CUCME